MYFPGPTLLDVISSAMKVSGAARARAEARYGACTAMLRAAERIATYSSNAHGQKVPTHSMFATRLRARIPCILIFFGCVQYGCLLS